MSIDKQEECFICSEIFHINNGFLLIRDGFPFIVCPECKTKDGEDE